MTRDELIGVLQDACGPDDEVVIGAPGAMLALNAAGVAEREVLGGRKVVQIVTQPPLSMPVPLVAA